jgi:hypothetical protein
LGLTAGEYNKKRSVWKKEMVGMPHETLLVGEKLYRNVRREYLSAAYDLRTYEATSLSEYRFCRDRTMYCARDSRTADCETWNRIDPISRQKIPHHMRKGLRKKYVKVALRVKKKTRIVSLCEAVRRAAAKDDSCVEWLRTTYGASKDIVGDYLQLGAYPNSQTLAGKLLDEPGICWPSVQMKEHGLEGVCVAVYRDDVLARA